MRRDLSAIFEKRVQLRLRILRSLRLHSTSERRLRLRLHLHLRRTSEPGFRVRRADLHRTRSMRPAQDAREWTRKRRKASRV